MGASTVKVATYYEQVVRKKVGCRSNKSIKKGVTWEWETFGGMYTFVIIIWLNLDKHGDLYLTVRASIVFMSYEKRTSAEEHHTLWTYVTAPPLLTFFEFGRSARKAEKLATFISSLSIELLSHDSCTGMTPVLWSSLLRRRLRRSSILFSKDLAFSEISDGMESLSRDWLRRATCQPRRCLLGTLKRRRNDDDYQKFAVSRRSNKWFLWSWDTEARMKKKQSNDPRREEAEEK